MARQRVARELAIFTAAASRRLAPSYGNAASLEQLLHARNVHLQTSPSPAAIISSQVDVRAGRGDRSSRERRRRSGEPASHKQPQQREEVTPDRVSAVLLVERLPVVLPKPPEWATEYEAFSFQRRQLYRKEYPREFLDAAASDSEADIGTAAGNRDREWTAIAADPFNAPSRRTKADETNDTKSLLRALDRRLYLLVKGGPAANAGISPSGWWLPERKYEEEETVRMCAERLNLGPSLNLFFVGNAPAAHLHPPADAPADNLVRFFFRAQVMGGEVQGGALKAMSYDDHAWLTKEEAIQQLCHGDEESERRQLFDNLLMA